MESHINMIESRVNQFTKDSQEFVHHLQEVIMYLMKRITLLMRALHVRGATFMLLCHKIWGYSSYTTTRALEIQKNWRIFLFNLEQYFQAMRPDSEKTRILVMTMYLNGKQNSSGTPDRKRSNKVSIGWIHRKIWSKSFELNPYLNTKFII